MDRGLDVRNTDGSLDDVIGGLEKGLKVDRYFKTEQVQKILKKNKLEWGTDYYTTAGVLYVKKSRLSDFKNMLSKLKVFNQWFISGEAEESSISDFYSIEIKSKK